MRYTERLDIESEERLLIASMKYSQEKKNAADKLSRATGTGKRILYTNPSPAYAAGNRYNLPPELDLEWDALSSALSANS